MRIAVAADHGGYPLKARIIRELTETGNEVFDLGTNSTEPVDYPDYARAVAEALQQGRVERAILLCGSGAGICVAANKFLGIRAATCHEVFSAHQCVEDDDCNVMCIGARVVAAELASDLIRTYMGAKFSGLERHRRRLEKIRGFERP
jgi:ribose 5-phosphate isomerase B